MRTFALFTIVLLLEGAAANVAAQPAGARLSDLVAALEASNPDFAAARREIEMRAARVQPAGAPPDPVISASFMGGFKAVPFFPPSSNPDALREFSIAQEIPYPGKLALRRQIANTDVGVSRFAAEDVRLQRIAELKAMYVEYRLFDRSLAIVRRNRTRLQQMARVTETRFAVGHGTQQDVVKAQLELSLLTARETAIERQQAVTRAQINRLLNRAPQQALDPGLRFDAALLPDIAALQRLAEEHNPALKRDEQAVTRNEQIESLARKAILPDFGAKLSFQKYAAGMPWMYGVEVMANVPLFANRRQRPMVTEATASLAASREMRAATRAAALGSIGDQHAVAAASQRLMRLYEDSVLPQARLALDASLAAYESGKVDFLTLLANFTTILDYELGLEEQQAQYYRALAHLEPIVGQTFLL